jgi:uncharacterized membrane protein
VPLVHKILHLKSETVFHEEKMTEGLIIAITLHAIFDALLEWGKIFLVVPFLFFGFLWLNYLLNKKEDHKMYGHVGTERTSAA